VKRLAEIRKTKDWPHRLDLAKNSKPGTDFDWLFKEAELALKLVDMKGGVEGEARLARIGHYFANLFRRGDGGQKLHEMGDALNTWRRHKPKLSIADRIRCELIALDGMFPAGKPRLVKVVNGKPIYGEPWSKLSYTTVIENLAVRLAENGIEITEDNCERTRHWIGLTDKARKRIEEKQGKPIESQKVVELDIVRRMIRRQAEELMIPIDSKPGRPPKSKGGQK
jgi:hypothetical protein